MSDADTPRFQMLRDFIPNSNQKKDKAYFLLESVAADKLKDQELALEGGTINISSIYSQGFLSTTRALQSSGVDLSQASISVQFDIGNRATDRQNSLEAAGKGAKAPSGNQSLHARVDSTSSESDHAVKKLKTG